MTVSPHLASLMEVLSADDLAALKRSTQDVSDLDNRTKARAYESFRHAYARAERVLDGSIAPLSA